MIRAIRIGTYGEYEQNGYCLVFDRKLSFAVAGPIPVVRPEDYGHDIGPEKAIAIATVECRDDGFWAVISDATPEFEPIVCGHLALVPAMKLECAETLRTRSGESSKRVPCDIFELSFTNNPIEDWAPMVVEEMAP